MKNCELRIKNGELRNGKAKRVALALSSFLILNSQFFILSCSGDKADAAKGPGAAGRGPIAFPVEVRPVESRRVEYSVTAVGSLDAFERVAVTARVAGAIEKVLFTEGQIVQRGHALAEIEPERYRLAV